MTPDEYCVFKPTLQAGIPAILQKTIGTKEFKLVYDEGGSRAVKNVPVAARRSRALRARRRRDPHAGPLGAARSRTTTAACAAAPTPMDIEWAKDGRTRRAVHRPGPAGDRARAAPDVHVARAVPAARARARPGDRAERRRARSPTGTVRVIPNAADLRLFQPGEVLVTDKTDPDWEPIMKKAAAIVTNRGGRTCHAAIVSRELGVPAIVGTERGTDALTTGQVVTVSCAEGETGFVYEGALRFDVERTDLSAIGRPRHEDHDERRQPGRGVRAVVHPQRRRRPGAPRVHHQQRHRRAPDGARAVRAARRPGARRRSIA